MAHDDADEDAWTDQEHLIREALAIVVTIDRDALFSRPPPDPVALEEFERGGYLLTALKRTLSAALDRLETRATAPARRFTDHLAV